nr:hypothetical protein [Tanacetum cinerariifolium]
MEGPKKRPLVALLAPMEGPKLLLASMEGPKQRKYCSDEMIKLLLEKCIEEMKLTGRNGTSLHKQSWARLGWIQKTAASLQSKRLPYSDICEIMFQSISANGDGQWTNKEFGASAFVSAASASGTSASEALAYEASASRSSAITERV